MRKNDRNLAEGVLNGDMKAAARLMTYIDDQTPIAQDHLKRIFHKTGGAYLIGLTGSPGVGKSTILDLLIHGFLEAGRNIGVVAVDPTSPFSGGAILGDRIRIQHKATGNNVFFRSLATRGAIGGLSRSVAEVVRVMEAMGKDTILVETVGVGQDEVDIVNLVHTTILVMVPGLGDDIQAIKAGIMEIGDIFVINKCERDGSEALERQLTELICYSERGPNTWTPEIVKTEAVKGKGMERLIEQIGRHRNHLEKTGKLQEKRLKRVEWELMAILREHLTSRILTAIGKEEAWQNMLMDVVGGRQDLYSLVDRLIRKGFVPEDL
jgi:LAO/AO transport system kinase